MKQAFAARAARIPATAILAACLAFSAVTQAEAEGPAVRQEEGKYFDKAGDPTYNVKEDGTVDWFTYSGFRRYHSACHVCHGPDALGSSYAPALAGSMNAMSYSDYLDVVVNGRKIVRADKTSYMPSFGENSNVMCFIDDIYVYLKARAADAVPRGRPEKREDKPEAAREYEKSCFGQ
ncbi:MAG: c-type cytochrome, methanol metabolism-related [Rhodomicrobium sp.]|nr:c-type cytochrome, methanol metabolism-related [Rhodomicrobium sp.]